MTDAEKLAVYDELRQAHRYISAISTEGFDELDRVALDAVDYVLYLAEGHFARMSE